MVAPHSVQHLGVLGGTRASAGPEKPVLTFMAAGCTWLGWSFEEASTCSSCPALGRQWVGRRPHVVHPFQWVLAFEIFIPLVLFFILLGLRQKKPTISVKEGEVQA